MMDIPGLEGQYSVTSHGRVYSHKTQKFLQVHDNGHGYATVCLCINGKSTHKYVHRLVAEAFIPNPACFPEVNHKDENPGNNCVQNLEWCTPKYNKNYGRRAQKFGISRGRPVICIDTGAVYHGIREAERLTHIPASCIWACCAGYKNSRSAGGLSWSYYQGPDG